MAAPAGAIIIGTTKQYYDMTSATLPMYAYVIANWPTMPYWLNDENRSDQLQRWEYTYHYSCDSGDRIRIFVRKASARYPNDKEVYIDGSGSGGAQQTATVAGDKVDNKDGYWYLQSEITAHFPVLLEFEMKEITRTGSYSHFHGVSLRTTNDNTTGADNLDGFAAINRNTAAERIYAPNNFLSAYHGMKAIAETMSYMQSVTGASFGVPFFGMEQY